MASSPVVALNHAVAVAMATTSDEGLTLIDRIDGPAMPAFTAAAGHRYAAAGIVVIQG